jgi:hypothetical protein
MTWNMMYPKHNWNMKEYLDGHVIGNYKEKLNN